MFERNCRPCARRCRNGRRHTYDSILRNSRRNGVAVEAAAAGFAAPTVCRAPVNPAAVPCESGLLRHKSQWEHRKAEVMVGSRVLTGVPVFTAPDTLRVVSGECSQFVPLEQVAGICVVDS